MKTLNDILTGILASDFEINLSKSQLALLLFVHYRLYASESQQLDISETELANLFQTIDRLESKDPSGTQARARAAITALKQSRIIVRSDCRGLAAIESIYSLTSLGRAIAENVARNLEFDSETLKSILSNAIVLLSELGERAAAAPGAAEWRSSVAVPLREFVQGAFERILRYQANLDLQHEAARAEIFRLVQTEADRAIDPCMALLEQSMQTITELHESLLGSLVKTDALVLEILARARDADHREAMLAADGILKRTNQISEWTRTRMEAWSLHYQNAHSFLRYVVRVDPKRQVAEKLKNLIRRFDENTPCLSYCREPGIRHLNNSFLDRPAERRTRPREDFALQELEQESALVGKIALDISGRFRERLTRGEPAHLADILRELEDVPWHELHLATGLAMQEILSSQERTVVDDFTWTAVRAQAQIQDIRIAK